MLTAITKHTVTLIDGTTETVELKRLTVRQLYQVFEILGSKTSAEAIALCASKPVEWVDTLSDESYGLLAKEVHEANFPRAVALIEKDSAMAIATAPYIKKMLGAAGTDGKEKSQDSSSPAHTEVTPSESLTSPPTGSNS